MKQPSFEQVAQEHNLRHDLKNAQGALDAIRRQITNLSRSANLSTDPADIVYPSWYQQLLDKRDSLRRKIAVAEKEGNLGISRQLNASLTHLESQIVSGLDRLPKAPKSDTKQALAALIARADALQIKVDDFTRRLDALYEAHRQRCSAESEADEFAQFEREEAASKYARFQAWRGSHH